MLPLAPGDDAPNFDLTSTEDVVLMLEDEVARTAIVLYVCPEVAGERTRRDLLALAAGSPEFAVANARVLVVSPATLEALKAAQRELDLPFPLLHDDRGFAARYGVAEAATEAALLLVDRGRRVAWTASSGTVEEALPVLRGILARQPRSSAGLPRSIVNRWIDHLVN